MTERFDAIIIGGGHNGLVAAATLAQSGKRVVVLERRPVLGGAAATEEVFPGFRLNTGAPDASLFFDEVAQRLGLTAGSVTFQQGQALLFAPQPDGRALTLWRDLQRSQDEIGHFSRQDAERFPAFKEQVERIGAVIRDMALLPPPDLGELQFDSLSGLVGIGLRQPELRSWGSVALKARRLGEADMMEFVRVLPMALQSYLDEWFESDALKGALGGSGVTGLTLGPRGAGTSLMFFYQNMHGLLNSRFVAGGMGRLNEALADRARAGGAVIRTGSDVAGILVEGDVEPVAVGVRLAGGEEIRAGMILSNADPRRTLFGLLGPQQLEPEVMRQVRNIIYRGSTAKLNLALSGLPEFTGQTAAEQLTGRIRISPSLDYLEKAYDAAKYGRYSTEPYLDIVIPTLHDPSLAPAGQHTMSVTVQYAPYALREGEWESEREAFADVVLDTLARYAPDLRHQLLHCQVLTPLDWEQTYGLTEGSPTHGHMGLDQLLVMRPIPGWSQYATPVKNLYLCGAGNHPGGGVTGVPGYNAARAALAARA